MGRQRVYGKKTGSSTLNSYTKFAADSLDNGTSADTSIPKSTTGDILALGSISGNAQAARAVVRLSPTCEIRSPKSRGALSSLKPGKEDTVSQSIKLRTIEDLRKDDDPSADENEPPRSCVSRRYGLRTEVSPKKTPHTVTTSIQQVKMSRADDISAMLATLSLRSSPESSILVPQSPGHIIQPELKTILPVTERYLHPILCCKNVTSNISNFSFWMAVRTHLMLEKVGEGSFGEVFRATSPNGEAVILKLMPLNAMKGRGSKSFTSINSAANEIRLLERMQRVPGFVEFRGACVLVGSLPEAFVTLWHNYKASGRTVQSRDPSKKTSYPTDQLWLLIEMSDAGRNLEPGQYAPPGEIPIKGQCYLGIGRAWDIFWEVVKSIAKAECWAHFEHRDLHMGNVCARDALDEPDQEDLTFVSAARPTPIRINTSKLEITIIDYSLSRAYMETEDDILFYDLKKDKHILKGEGDLQYDMYRYMADAIGERSCREFVPETNVVWLWYLLNRILAMTKPPSPRAKARKRGLVTREARKLSILEEIQDWIRPENMSNWTVDSAAALLAVCVEQGWLFADDVMK